MLHAVAVTAQQVVVIVTLMAGNWERTDSVFVVITNVNPPPVLANFFVHPRPPDNAKPAAGSAGSLYHQAAGSAAGSSQLTSGEPGAR